MYVLFITYYYSLLFIHRMTRVSMKKIKKSSTSCYMFECKKYFYLRNDAIRKKLTQFLHRNCKEDSALDITTCKKIKKLKDMTHGCYNISEIKFGKRGAIFFSEDCIDFYNETVKAKPKRNHEKDNYPLLSLPQIPQIPQNKSIVGVTKRLVKECWDIEELQEIKQICDDKIFRITHLLGEDVRIPHNNILHQQNTLALTKKQCKNMKDSAGQCCFRAKSVSDKKETMVEDRSVVTKKREKQKNRIKPTFVSNLNYNKSSS